MIRGLRPLLLTGLLSLSPLAEAHSPIAGIGNFYNGMLHPLLVPAHLICVLVLGLLAGQSGLAHARVAMLAFPPAMLAGMLAGNWLPAPDAEVALLALAAILGTLLAVQWRMPVALFGLPALVCGLAVGLDSLPEGQSGSTLLLAMLGALLGSALLLLSAVTLAESLAGPVQRIALRIAGAWMGAAAILVLSLALVPQA